MRKSTLFNIFVTLLFIPAIYTTFYPGKIVLISVLSLSPILFVILFFINSIKKNEFDDRGIFILFISMCYIIFFRGIIDSKTQQDYTVLFSSTLFTMVMYPLFLFLPQKKYISSIFNALIKIAIPLSVFTFFFRPTDGFMSFQHNFSFIYFFVFFIPFVKRKWRIIILTISILTPLLDISRRSSLINIFVCFAILLFYYLVPKTLFKNLAKKVFLIFIISPIIFLILGLIGVFNVFDYIEDSNNDLIISSQNKERNLFVDSRTSIYLDVFTELSQKNALLLGLGGVGKTKTSLTEEIDANYDRIYKEGRRGTESGMLNFIQWGGLFSAFIYWLLLSIASFKAIFKSNNNFYIMIGLFVAFKVLYSFIEDQLMPNVATFYLIFFIGLCYNIQLRNFNNNQIRKLSYIIFK